MAPSPGAAGGRSRSADGEIVRARGVVVDGLRLGRAAQEGPPGTAEQMEDDLRVLIATVQCEHLRGLLDAVFAPGTETWAHYRTAPAAKRYHHPYRHGLLEHPLSVAQGVSAMAATFPGIDRDVAVTGALLHDIGKLEAYTSDPLAIELTDLGKLQGEIPLGYYRVRRLIEDLPGFPAELPSRCCTSSSATTARTSTAPRSPVHARGDARAHDRQPRRPPRPVRPHREGPPRGRPVVGLRPRALRRRVVRGQDAA